MNFYEDDDAVDDEEASVSQWTDYDLYGRAQQLNARYGQEERNGRPARI